MAAIATVCWPAAPAQAHFALAKSSPAAGEHLDRPVIQIRLTFTKPGTPIGTAFWLRDETGTAVPVTRSSADKRRTWVIRPATPLYDGRFTLTWKVAAPDAHQKSGVLTFTVRAALPEPTHTPEMAGTPVPTSSATSAGEPSAHRADPMPDAAPARKLQPDRITQLAGVFGRWLCYAATLLGIGALAFVLSTLVGSRFDVRVAQVWVRLTGIGIVAGTAIEALVLAALWSEDGSVTSALDAQAMSVLADTPTGVAVALRLTGGLGLIVAGTLEPAPVKGQHQPAARTRSHAADPGAGVAPEQRQLAPVGGRDQQALVSALDGFRAYRGLPPRGTGSAGSNHDWFAPTADRPAEPPAATDPGSPAGERLRARAAHPVLLSLAVALVLASFLFDGHTVTTNPRVVVALADLAHITAAAVWTGGVLFLAVLLVGRARRGEPAGVVETAARFAVPASIGLAVAGAAGLLMAVCILDQPAELVNTPWGRMLLVKTGLVALAALVGLYNNRWVVPALDAGSLTSTVRLRRTVTVEALLMLGVVLATALLVNAQN